MNTQWMALHPASCVPWAHSSLKLVVLPASPVEGAWPPSTLEPLPSTTVRLEVRPGLVFFLELNLLFRNHGCLPELQSSVAQRIPYGALVWVGMGKARPQHYGPFRICCGLRVSAMASPQPLLCTWLGGGIMGQRTRLCSQAL